MGGSRPPVCVIGDGGSGKTSAAVALMSWMAARVSPQSPTSPGKSFKGGGGKELLPVFVPLPSVKGRLLEHRGLSNYIEGALGLDESGREALAERYDVVVLLDSLDETG
eukprot:Hpha_TRINITY_DN707_c0_g1::TRINITY_DN707_c0_g1_i1::g.28913::m.28913